MWRDFLLNVKRLNETKNENENIYKVQIAYYTNEDAKNALNKLKEHGFKGFVKKIKGMYLVQFGAFENKLNAQKLANHIKTFGFNAVVTSEEKRQKILKVGDKVRIKEGAKTFEGKRFSPFVYKMTFDVIEIKGERVVIGRKKVITGAVHIDDLIY